jgi:hypothetical protein
MTATAITSLGEETEVTEKAKRRAFTVDYKRKIVKEAEACQGPGEIGALLRREGLYSSHLTTWRQAIPAFAANTLTMCREGPYQLGLDCTGRSLSPCSVRVHHARSLAARSPPPSMWV